MAPTDKAKYMHIHKPKAARSRREFVSEIGVIVVGVLIALALEQAIEWLHVQLEVEETRAALRAEMSRNAAIALYNSAEDKCLFAFGQRWVAWAKGSSSRPLLLYPQLKTLRSDIWDLSKNGGAITHMSLKERAAFAEYYSLVEAFNQNREIQRQVGVGMAAFMLSNSLSKSQSQRLIEEENSSGVMNRYQWVLAANVVRTARELGADPAPLSASARDELVQFCRAAGGPPPAA